MSKNQVETVKCHDCGKTIPKNKAISVKRFDDNKHVDAFICQECYEKGQELDAKRKESNKSSSRRRRSADSFFDRIFSGHSNKNVLIGATIVGVIVLILILSIGIGVGGVIMQWWGWLILAVVVAYAIFAQVYCVFIDSFMTEMFLEVSCFGLSVPVLGIFLLVLTIPLAILFTSLISMFCFPGILIKNIGKDN